MAAGHIDQVPVALGVGTVEGQPRTALPVDTSRPNSTLVVMPGMVRPYESAPPAQGAHSWRAPFADRPAKPGEAQASRPETGPLRHPHLPRHRQRPRAGGGQPAAATPRTPPPQIRQCVGVLVGGPAGQPVRPSARAYHRSSRRNRRITPPGVASTCEATVAPAGTRSRRGLAAGQQLDRRHRGVHPVRHRRRTRRRSRGTHRAPRVIPPRSRPGRSGTAQCGAMRCGGLSCPDVGIRNA